MLDANEAGASFFSFVYILYGIAGFYDILSRQETPHLERSWFFWFNVAFLVYSSGSFLIFLLRQMVVLKNQEAYRAIWHYVFLSLNIFKYLLVGVALYCYEKGNNKKMPAATGGQRTF